MVLLDAAQRARAAGVLVGMAAGDALGAPLEFGPPLPPDAVVAMTGGGAFGWEPGEWTDDTAMSVALAEVVAAGHDLRDEQALDAVVVRWAGWAHGAKDVGVQTRQVLSVASPTAATVGAAARDLHARTGRTGGNGSLMRTAPVALAHLDDPVALADAAARVSALTHVDQDAGEACVLWCLAIRHAVLTGELDLRSGLDAWPAERARVWRDRIDAAERSTPDRFMQNGWVVEALQAAWCAIATTPVGGPAHLRRALEAAVRGGRDTDTVAAIAGALLGAAHGVTAVPAGWRRVLHGWPGVRADDLVQLGLHCVGDRGWGDVDYSGWGHTDALVRHPHDDGVWLGGVGALDHLPAEVDAVVSLCRIGPHQVPSRIGADDRVSVWLVDSDDPAENPQLPFVLADTVDVVRSLRAAGRTVFLHCVQAHTRTPTVAALYGATVHGLPVGEALADVVATLPHANVDRARRLLQRATENRTA